MYELALKSQFVVIKSFSSDENPNSFLSSLRCLPVINCPEQFLQQVMRYLLLFPDPITANFHKDFDSIYTSKVSKKEISIKCSCRPEFSCLLLLPRL